MFVVASALAAIPCAAEASPSGSGTIYVGPALSGSVRSLGYASWSVASRTVLLKADGYLLASGYCMTTWFDWLTSTGSDGGHRHHDSRAVRQCYQSATQESDAWYESAVDNGWIVDVNRFSACYGQNNSLNGCINFPGTNGTAGLRPVFDGVTKDNYTTSYWVRTASGGYLYGSGGDPHSSNS